MSEEQHQTNDLEGVVAFAELIQNQPGSVVSRVIVKNAGGTVTAFAFDQEEGLSEHTTPYDALVLLTEGEAEVTISKVPHRVTAGHLLKLPAGEPHALKAITAFKMILVMVKS